jgi:hypothetical protein
MRWDSARYNANCDATMRPRLSSGRREGLSDRAVQIHEAKEKRANQYE